MDAEPTDEQTEKLRDRRDIRDADDAIQRQLRNYAPLCRRVDGQWRTGDRRVAGRRADGKADAWIIQARRSHCHAEIVHEEQADSMQR